MSPRVGLSGRGRVMMSQMGVVVVVVSGCGGVMGRVSVMSCVMVMVIGCRVGDMLSLKGCCVGVIGLRLTEQIALLLLLLVVHATVELLLLLLLKLLTFVDRRLVIAVPKRRWETSLRHRRPTCNHSHNAESTLISVD